MRPELLARLAMTAAGVAALLAITAGPIARARHADDELATLRAARAEMAFALSEETANCVARGDTDHAVFRGCIDWHSAVHGVWALIAYGNLTGDKRYDSLVVRTLDPAGLEVERRLLLDRPQFEMPYGRAWLLRLAIEHERRYGGGLLDQLGEVAADSLLRHYRAHPPQPRAKAYRSASWALINLHDYFSAKGDAARLRQTEALIRAAFVDTDDLDCSLTADERPEFMATCTNWAWAASKVMGRTEFATWLRGFMPPERLPAPIVPRTDHENGLNFSRAWGLAALADATGEAAYRRAYAAHVAAAYRDRASWAGDYGSVGHWVAQFGTLAIHPLFQEQR